MIKIQVLQGLPGSGKTTYANEWLKQDPTNRVIICKDDIGMELANVSTKCEVPRDKSFRKKILDEQARKIKLAMKEGKDICIADTNLFKEAINRVRVAANETGIPYGIEIINHFCDVPLIEILERNEKRGCEMVPESVLYEMYYHSDVDFAAIHHVHQNPNNPAVVVFDMDGTLAIKGDRGIYEWDKVGVDLPNTKVVDLLHMYHSSDFLPIIVSARQSTPKCLESTKEWLERFNIPYAKLYMRQEGDMRRDWIVKEELLKQVIKEYYVHMWIDDRHQVVTHMRTLGIDVLQCSYGRY